MVTRCAGVVLASVMAFAPVGWAQNRPPSLQRSRGSKVSPLPHKPE